jgi:hypothetical protein
MRGLFDLSEKGLTVESVAKRALKDNKLLSELLEGVTSKEDEVRYNSFRSLLIISEEHPELLYPHWGYFSGLLSSENSYHRYIAVYMITNLTRVDTENRFEGMSNEYLNLLNDKSVMVAGHLAVNLGKIAKAKPRLQTKITEMLLDIDKTYPRPERRDLMKGSAIEALDQYFEEAKDKERIIEFVKEQLESTSPKTRKKAKEFLNKWGS